MKYKYLKEYKKYVNELETIVSKMETCNSSESCMLLSAKFQIIAMKISSLMSELEAETFELFDEKNATYKRNFIVALASIFVNCISSTKFSLMYSSLVLLYQVYCLVDVNADINKVKKAKEWLNNSGCIELVDKADSIIDKYINRSDLDKDLLEKYNKAVIAIFSELYCGSSMVDFDESVKNVVIKILQMDLNSSESNFDKLIEETRKKELKEKDPFILKKKMF